MTQGLARVKNKKIQKTFPRRYGRGMPLLIVNSLLKNDSRASRFKLAFDLFCFRLRCTFFNGFTTSFNKLFGFFQAKTCDRAYFFNNSNLVAASRFKNDVKVSLFFCAACSIAACNSSNGTRCRRSGFAPLVFTEWKAPQLPLL